MEYQCWQEVYEVRDWKAGRTLLLTTNLERAYNQYREGLEGRETVGLSRVRDGAIWGQNGAIGFGPRLYTSAGDKLRMERAEAHGIQRQ